MMQKEEERLPGVGPLLVYFSHGRVICLSGNALPVVS